VQTPRDPDKVRVSVIFGTRPEAIKLAPLVLALRKHGRFAPHVCVTGQHREMLDQVLDVFGIVPESDLAIMGRNQTLTGLTAQALLGLDEYLEATEPDLVIVQGDTTTAFCAALAAFYRRVPVAHVEAGLRTGDKFAPFPEEINRVLVSQVADWNFAPTKRAAENLVKCGVAAEHVFVTGNTVIDALHIVVAKVRLEMPAVPGISQELMNSGRVIVLITGHRRENFGGPFEEICQAILILAAKFPSVVFVYPVHLNPNVREPVFRALDGIENIRLIEPLAYLPFVALMDRSKLVLTDSGGVQEEAPSLGKPVLVMRERTERPEAVEAGTAKLVGTDARTIDKEVTTLLTNSQEFDRMARAINPYGDGRATERIIEALSATSVTRQPSLS
jgi:UDP-N-acetylglucosamine 2-epimerase (non-hydrolysing)